MRIKNSFIESRNTSLIVLADERKRAREKAGKTVWKDGVNQRANIKQREVCSKFNNVLDENCNITEVDLCEKNIDLTGVDHIDRINVYYYSKNSFFARVFDLILQTSYHSKKRNIKNEIELAIEFQGNFKIKDANFITRKGSALGSELAEKLNEVSLIKERILKLEAIDIRLQYDPKTYEWKIGLATGKGSTVWSLLPPLMMLVNFSDSDTIKVIELFQLIICEIMEFEKEHILL